MKSLVAIAILCAPVQAQSLDGVWRSRGYGYVFDIHGPALKSFEVTETTCVPGFTANRDTTSAPGREATFKSADGEIFFVRTSASNDHKLQHNEGSASDIRIDRLPRIPAVCDHPPANTPLDNFEVFTRTWAEHYISFDLKHTDWSKVVADNRPDISSQTTPAQLFDVFEGMIKPFGDTHTFIEARALKRYFRGMRPGTGLPQSEFLAVTERVYLKGPLRKFCEGKIQFGHIDNTTGYLRILAFAG